VDTSQYAGGLVRWSSAVWRGHVSVDNTVQSRTAYGIIPVIARCKSPASPLERRFKRHGLLIVNRLLCDLVLILKVYLKVRRFLDHTEALGRGPFSGGE
jgi:hypothetical protein